MKKCLLHLLLFSSWAVFADTAQDMAFLSVWRAHRANPSNHAQVVEAGMRVMDNASTLGEWLPVVKNLTAWHLLMDGRDDDAAKVFETAVAKSQTRHPLYHSADIMARRWLTRIDATRVASALRKYYAEKVEYPDTLAPILEEGIPRKDRFGEEWQYALTDFSRLGGLKKQRYSLYSAGAGRELTKLANAKRRPYAVGYSATLLRSGIFPPTARVLLISRSGEKAEVNFKKIDEISKGWRFVKLAVNGNFALLVDSFCDYFLVVEGKK